jgi:hypothetical protein
MATGGTDAALLAGWKPAATVLVAPRRCAHLSQPPFLRIDPDAGKG